MRRSSKYYPLAFLVECKPTYMPQIFEVIAGFNVGQVAGRYAAECKRTNPRNEYRVMTRTGKGFRPATEEDMA